MLYSEILLKKSLQLLYYGLFLLLSVATTEAGHRREYLVNVGACCAYRSITKSILHELDGLVCFQVLAYDNLIQVVMPTLLHKCLPRLAYCITDGILDDMSEEERTAYILEITEIKKTMLQEEDNTPKESK